MDTENKVDTKKFDDQLSAKRGPDGKKRNFEILTTIHVYEDGTTTYDTGTDIGYWEKKKDTDDPLHDPNDILYYYWLIGYLHVMESMSPEERVDFANKILEKIYEFQYKVLTVDTINEERGNPLYRDGEKAPVTDPNKEERTEYFIDVKITVSDDDKHLHFDFSTDIMTAEGAETDKRLYMHNLFANALAQGVTYVPTKLLQEHLAKIIRNELVLNDPALRDVINQL